MNYSVDDLAKKLSTIPDNEDKAKLIIDQLKAKRYSQDFLDMEPLAHQLIDISIELNEDILSAYAYDALGAIYFYKDQYDNSLEYGFKSLEISEKHLDYYLASVNLHMIGLIYYRMDNLDLAEKYFLKSVQYNSDFPNVYCNLGLLYYERGDIEKSLFYLDQGLIKSKKQHNRAITGMGIYYKALLKHCNNELADALEDLNQAWRAIDTIADTYLKISILIEKAAIYNELNQKEEALKNLNEAVSVANRYSSNALLSKAWLMLSKIYEQDNDFENAYKYLILSSDLSYSMRTQEKTNRLSEIQTKYEVVAENLDMMQLINQNSRITTVGVVSGGIVHEINQPLTAIKISCESILYWSRRNCGAIPDILVNQLNDISESVNYVSSIIEQIRSFWKTNDINTSLARVDLNQFIYEKLSFIKKRLQSEDIFINFKPEKHKYISMIQSSLLEQVLMYLFNISFNIIKDCPDDCEKRLTLDLDHEVGFNIIKIHLDNKLHEPLEKFLNATEETARNKSILFDFKISKYFINQFNGYVTYADKPHTHFKIALPGNKENK